VTFQVHSVKLYRRLELFVPLLFIHSFTYLLTYLLTYFDAGDGTPGLLHAKLCFSPPAMLGYLPQLSQLPLKVESVKYDFKYKIWYIDVRAKVL
jgi:hypothetical protein